MQTSLQCFINFEQDDWPYWHQWPAFAHAPTHEHRATSRTASQRAVRSPKFPPQATEGRFCHMAEMHALLAQNLQEANASHLPVMFAPGTKIMLNARTSRMVRPNKKTSYRLDLPERGKGIHKCLQCFNAGASRPGCQR